jgi:homoserine kinase
VSQAGGAGAGQVQGEEPEGVPPAAHLPGDPSALRWAEAWAPASIGNISVGFDLLGQSVGVAGDRVRVERVPDPAPGAEVVIEALDGLPLSLPSDPARNTAGAALLALRTHTETKYGFRLRIHKGIPLGSGMGGSAASAVAAVVAANALSREPLPPEALYPFALAGEGVATGSPHGDNVAPQLLGGLVLALPDRILPLPVPGDLHCALVHPHQVLETRRSREVLGDPYPMDQIVAQQALLARFLAACFLGDRELLEGAVADVLVEPRRAPLIPGFVQAKAAALSAGALAAGISGGGPSLFAWCRDEERAEAARGAMVQAFRALGIEADGWTAPVKGPAARVTACG